MKKQLGLSLIELMISITLGLVLLAGVTQMFLSSKTTFISQQGVSRIQETGRLAIDFIARDLRMASYYGCVKTVNPAAPGTYNITDTLTANAAANSLSGLHMNFLTGLRGYNTSSSLVSDKLPNGVSTDLGSGFTVKSNSDVLVIHGANERGIPISGANTNTAVTGYSNSTLVNGCVDGFCNGGIAVISDCGKGRLFKINSNPAVGSNLVTLTHSDSWNVATTPKNQYSAGSVLPVHTIVYFVATSSVANSVSSLWQRVDTGASFELLQGVEDLYITYSADGANYKRAKDVTNWDAIYSVKVEVLVRGLAAKDVEGVQPYTFGQNADGTPKVNTPTDNIMRQVFRSTFAVRTRINI